MAVTKIWAVKSHLPRVVDYAENAEKTRREELHNVFSYATRTEKTEQLLYVTALNCNAETAPQEMQITKARYGKEGGILAFHAIQSFSKGEVTPSLAHEIGVAFARRMWGERFEVVIGTHLDTDNLHNHFVFNSVSFRDGKRYYDNKKSYYGQIRPVSDALCREYGISVIEHAAGRGKHYAEIIAERQGRPTIRKLLLEDLDSVIAQSYNFLHFTDNLKRRGYKVRGGNLTHFSITPPFGKAPVRLNKIPGYSPQEIQDKIMRRRDSEIPRQPPVTAIPRRPHMYQPISPLPKRRGSFFVRNGSFRAQYYFFLTVLLRAKRQQIHPRVRHALKRDIIRFEQYREQAAYLRRHRLDTPEQLDRQESNLASLIGTLKDHRADLCRARRRGEDAGPETERLTAALRALRREQRILARIRSRFPEITQKLDFTRQVLREERRTAQQQEKYHEIKRR